MKATSGSMTISNSSGFGSTTNTFKKKSNATVMKPIDPMVMEEFKKIC